MNYNKKNTNIITQLSNKYQLPAPVIEVICNSPFKFAKDVISNDNDTKTIMFAYLFKLKLKKKYEKLKQLEDEVNRTECRNN